jgi:transglutaminase-like putative cysteine protease
MTAVTVSVRASAAYDLSAETFLLLMVEPRRSGDAHTVLEEKLLTTPTPFSDLDSDMYGNLRRRLLAPPGPFNFEYTATIKAEANAAVPDDAEEHPPRDLPADTLLYTLPSRYCQSDRLTRMATDLFGQGTPGGGARVNAVASWVRQNVEYRYGTTNAHTSAVDTVVERVGVCRDFAHLTIAFCRALGIPARYVSGYALGLKPCDFHGYVQAFVGGRWHNVDATFAGVRPALIPIAVGRDAADLAMLTLFGTGELRNQSVEVTEVS